MVRKIDVLIAAFFALNLVLYSAGNTCIIQSITGIEENSLIRDISYIDLKNYTERTPPSKLVLGIYVKEDVFFKFSDNQGVLKGGLFKSGFNTFSIESRDLFLRSGAYTFSIEVKAGSVIQRQYFDIEITLDLPLQPDVPEKKTEVESQYNVYKISLYVGDQLIASSQRSQRDKLNLKLDIPPSHGVYQPFGPLKKDDPMMHSVPIPAVLAEVYKLFKNVVKKRKEKKLAAKARMVKQMRVSFLRVNTDGVEIEVKAQVLLKLKH